MAGYLLVSTCMIPLICYAPIRYTLKTEHCSSTLVAKYFDGFELTRGEGFWQGKREDCVSISILGTEADVEKITNLARDIREQYRQDEVWITSEPVILTRVVIGGLVKEGF